MFAGVRTALLCGAVQASAPPVVYVTPLNTELIPDPTIATAGDFAFSRSTFLNPGCQFNAVTTPQWWLAVPNTQGQVLTPGTYRLQITVANWISQTGILSIRVGCDTSSIGGVTSAQWSANTISGNGTWFKDIVVAANTTGGGFQIRTSSGSGNQMDFTNVSLKRTA